jgi:hypothetical protein
MNDNSRGFFGERPLPEFVVDPQVLRRRTRRDALLLCAEHVRQLEGESPFDNLMEVKS